MKTWTLVLEGKSRIHQSHNDSSSGHHKDTRPNQTRPNFLLINLKALKIFNQKHKCYPQCSVRGIIKVTSIHHLGTINAC